MGRPSALSVSARAQRRTSSPAGRATLRNRPSPHRGKYARVIDAVFSGFVLALLAPLLSLLAAGLFPWFAVFVPGVIEGEVSTALLAAIGIPRMPDARTRLSATSKASPRAGRRRGGP